jgi:uroporphyrinogen decarboxylase
MNARHKKGLTPRERFIAALECRPLTGRVPHFELEFYLTMEAFGRVHPSQRNYHQWHQMSQNERELHLRDVADLHVCVARRFEQSGMLYNPPKGWELADTLQSIEYVRELSEMDFLVLLHGDATWSLPNGDTMMDFIVQLYEAPGKIKDKAQRMVDNAIQRAEYIKKRKLVDGFCLCSDYCFNNNPFLSPAQFDEFVTPYLIQLVAAYKEMGFYVIKHTDGNILPILDSLAAAKPHALHSIDPQGGVDIAHVKKLIGDRICLIGNVNCALLQNGTDEEVIESARYALQHGMPGGGYVFSTSNCIYTGMPLERYELMLDVWRKEGNYS